MSERKRLIAGLCPIMILLVIACGGLGEMTTTRVWSGGSEQMPVVDLESAGPSFEIVVTVPHPDVEIPTVRQEWNSYGRMNLVVWIRNAGRGQEMVEVKAKFFAKNGRILDSAADWTQAFLNPGEAKQVELLCAEEGAETFKVLLR